MSFQIKEDLIFFKKLKLTEEKFAQRKVLIVAPIFVVQVNRTWKNLSANDNEVKSDSMPDVGTVRRIDAGALNFKHLFISVFVLLLSAVTYLYFKDVNVDFSL